ncbi:SSI family serine proteinase inhibitor [Streptomyces sp. NPDC023723]|uniref:SSI family serine proteinase inhibitor n=1 Tax=Streptomyces sp. NPDC023723 TaxID=3154323 RepID=UPI0033EE27F4
MTHQHTHTHQHAHTRPHARTHPHARTRTRPTTAAARAVRAALLAAVALLVAWAAPAQATEPGGGPSGDWLLLTVTRGDAPSATDGGTLLLCDPPRGPARAAAACAELAAARGDIGAIPQRKAICPMIHAPVTAQAHGSWRGRPVRYEETFPNACVMTSRTGTLFAPADAPA